jgi:hypothetical protein
MTKLQYAISRAALMARINRKIRREDLKLCKLRSQRSWTDLGDYYIVDLRRNFLVEGHINPVAYARELGVLAPYEKAEEFDS